MVNAGRFKIAVVAAVLWILGWFSYIVVDHLGYTAYWLMNWGRKYCAISDYSKTYLEHFAEDVLGYVIVYAVLIPVAVFCVWYLVKKFGVPKIKREKKPTDVWPLLKFAKMYGSLRVDTRVNGDTGEKMSVCVFTNRHGKETRVEFSDELGPIDPAEIAERKKTLRVKKEGDIFKLI